MVDFLLYATLNCQEADDLMLRIKANENLPPVVVVELVETVKESLPECYWDAND